jgi:hypothetical protein
MRLSAYTFHSSVLWEKQTVKATDNENKMGVRLILPGWLSGTMPTDKLQRELISRTTSSTDEHLILLWTFRNYKEQGKTLQKYYKTKLENNWPLITEYSNCAVCTKVWGERADQVLFHTIWGIVRLKDEAKSSVRNLVKKASRTIRRALRSCWRLEWGNDMIRLAFWKDGEQ